MGDIINCERIAGKILQRDAEQRRQGAPVLDMAEAKNPYAWIDVALRGKTPAEQAMLITAIGAMFGWEDITLEKGHE